MILAPTCIVPVAMRTKIEPRNDCGFRDVIRMTLGEILIAHGITARSVDGSGTGHVAVRRLGKFFRPFWEMRRP